MSHLPELEPPRELHPDDLTRVSMDFLRDEDDMGVHHYEREYVELGAHEDEVVLSQANTSSGPRMLNREQKQVTTARSAAYALAQNILDIVLCRHS